MAPTLAETELVFDALAHEVRRHIIQLLSHLGGELPSGYLARRFSHSWPTTTRHLRVLEGAGLATHEKRGREVLYSLEARRLEQARAFLDGVSAGWDRAIERLRRMVEERPDRGNTAYGRSK